jgi:transcriptional regulator with XRE-family HTH domain
MSDFGDNLRVLIASKGWNQKEAAAALGVSQQNISVWLRGDHEPSTVVLIGVAEAFGVSVDELVRAPGPKVKEARANYGENVLQGRWFRILRVAWHDCPDERGRIELGIRSAWPNQCDEILEWLDEIPKGRQR